MRNAFAVTAALSLAGCVASNASPPPREVAVLKHEVHSQCPLAVNHPSVLLVRSREVWAKMMVEARTVPPPYDAASTNFGQFSVLVVALPSTPAPTTVVSLPGERAVVLSGSRRLEVRVKVTEPETSPGTMLPTVVGSPCLVAWVRAVGDVAHVVARTVEGRVLAEHKY